LQGELEGPRRRLSLAQNQKEADELARWKRIAEENEKEANRLKKVGSDCFRYTLLQLDAVCSP
jgi:hypothetical protein